MLIISFLLVVVGIYSYDMIDYLAFEANREVKKNDKDTVTTKEKKSWFSANILFTADAPPRLVTKIPSPKSEFGNKTTPAIKEIIPTKNEFLYSLLPKIAKIAGPIRAQQIKSATKNI